MSTAPAEELQEAWSRIRADHLLLFWFLDRAKGRQEDPDSAAARMLNGLEESLRDFGKSYGQNVNWKVDRAYSLRAFVYSIIVDGVGIVNRLGKSKRDSLIQKLEAALGKYDCLINDCGIRVSLLEPYEKRPKPSSYDLIRRMRNSLSHGRYRYCDSTNEYCFRDRDERAKQDTAKFFMPPMSVYKITFNFGIELLRAAEKDGLYRSSG